jgi:hypothetical protein
MAGVKTQFDHQIADSPRLQLMMAIDDINHEARLKDAHKIHFKIKAD